MKNVGISTGHKRPQCIAAWPETTASEASFNFSMIQTSPSQKGYAATGGTDSHPTDSPAGSRFGLCSSL